MEQLDDKLVEIIEIVDRNRQSKRERIRLDRCARAQARHRAKLKVQKSPTRAEMAAVMFNIFLVVFKRYPDLSLCQGLVKEMKNTLRQVGFDVNQIDSRLAKMLKRPGHALASWSEERIWRQEKQELFESAKQRK